MKVTIFNQSPTPQNLFFYGIDFLEKNHENEKKMRINFGI